MEAKADIDVKSRDWGNAPIALALDKGRPEILELLFERCPTAEFQGRDIQEQTPLRSDEIERHLDAVRLLIRQGADPNLNAHFDVFGTGLRFCPR